MSMRRSPEPMLDSETITAVPLSAVFSTCVPPPSSEVQSPDRLLEEVLRVFDSHATCERVGRPGVADLSSCLVVEGSPLEKFLDVSSLRRGLGEGSLLADREDPGRSGQLCVSREFRFWY